MKLYEIVDNDWDDPEETPVQAYDRVVNRAASLNKHVRDARRVQDLAARKIPQQDFVHEDKLLATDSSIPNKKAQGYLPYFGFRLDSSGKWTKWVIGWIKITPQNQNAVKQFAHANKIYMQANEAEFENHRLIKRHKAKYQAWTRKQPGYVGRDEAKDYAKDVAKGIMDFCKQQFMMEPTLVQQNFWKKGNKFVVELGFNEKPQNGKTLWNKLKETILPQLKDHLKTEGLVGSIKTNYFSPDSTNVVIFIDAQDVLAKNKEDQNEDI